MKINKINKLKNFGIFQDFSWESNLPDFKKLNLIYGWNRSGKTTISRIFASCEKKCVYCEDKFKQYPEKGEFEISTDNVSVKNVNVQDNILPIKVFNKDFIDDNISFDPSNPCNPIYISIEDIEAKNNLKILNEENKELIQNYQIAKNKKESTIKIEDSFRISAAQTITQLLTDKKIHYRYYSYDKSKVKDKITEIGINNFTDKILTEDDTIKYEKISKSEEVKDISAFQRLKFEFTFEEEIVSDFGKIFKKIQLLLRKKVISETLERLKNDQELNTWVEQGF